MRILVIGTGRGGTNWTAEIVRASEAFKFISSGSVINLSEDREFYKRHILIDNYMTKLVTEHKDFTWKNIKDKLDRFSDLKMIWVTKHPVDNVMSKMIRGKESGNYEGDYSYPGAIKYMQKFYKMYKLAFEQYPDRCLHVKMERYITHPKDEIKKIADFLDVAVNPYMLTAYKFIKQHSQKHKYKGNLDKRRIYVHKKLATAYDGLLRHDQQELQEVANTLKEMIKEFGYECPTFRLS